MSAEKVDIKKLFDFSPVAFAKVAGLALKIGVVILIVYGAFSLVNHFFPKPTPNVNNPDITVESGGKVEYKVIQNEDRRRMEYFAGMYGDVQGNDRRVGIFGGFKF